MSPNFNKDEQRNANVSKAMEKEEELKFSDYKNRMNTPGKQQITSSSNQAKPANSNQQTTLNMEFSDSSFNTVQSMF